MPGKPNSPIPVANAAAYADRSCNYFRRHRRQAGMAAYLPRRQDQENAVTDIETFVESYIGIWNEPDDEARRRTVQALWQEDARHLAPTIEAVGHAGIEDRVANAYRKWVREKGNVFRLRDGVDGHHGAIKLRWEMLPRRGGGVVSIGFDFLVLGKDGRIRTGYQFIEA
jgi:hypothetical protein